MAPDVSYGEAKSLANKMTNTINAASLVADPPLTVKITDMLDEIQKRLHGAAGELNGLSGRLFGDETGYGSASPGEQPTDFSGLVAERLHHLIGLAGDINGAAMRISSRL